ncbi:hypothetical protein PoB_001714300 [Plakobranchus ocellatus]|uniref:Uncharacterized protein n=1 Tax=Plakobranchus ocellatus TaxID=259542 RepID=A0AAV3Z858_9GAST|nr:hypothetical protein PoB_001714300 [Plakobranchus ocellatus]
MVSVKQLTGLIPSSNTLANTQLSGRIIQGFKGNVAGKLEEMRRVGERRGRNASIWFMCIANPRQGGLRLSGLRKARAPLARLEPLTEGSLQMSTRVSYPLCHREHRR